MEFLITKNKNMKLLVFLTVFVTTLGIVSAQTKKSALTKTTQANPSNPTYKETVAYLEEKLNKFCTIKLYERKRICMDDEKSSEKSVQTILKYSIITRNGVIYLQYKNLRTYGTSNINRQETPQSDTSTHLIPIYDIVQVTSIDAVRENRKGSVTYTNYVTKSEVTSDCDISEFKATALKFDTKTESILYWYGAEMPTSPEDFGSDKVAFIPIGNGETDLSQKLKNAFLNLQSYSAKQAKDKFAGSDSKVGKKPTKDETISWLTEKFNKYVLAEEYDPSAWAKARPGHMVLADDVGFKKIQIHAAQTYATIDIENESIAYGLTEFKILTKAILLSELNQYKRSSVSIPICDIDRITVHSLYGTHFLKILTKVSTIKYSIHTSCPIEWDDEELEWNIRFSKNKIPKDNYKDEYYDFAYIPFDINREPNLVERMNEAIQNLKTFCEAKSKEAF